VTGNKKSYYVGLTKAIPNKSCFLDYFALKNDPIGWKKKKKRMTHAYYKTKNATVWIDSQQNMYMYSCSKCVHDLGAFIL